jgi:3-oxoacyl-[acyl-carrier protein] reductase
MDLGLRGKVALVGGSSTGLGRAVAEALAAEGCDVVMNARSPGPLDEAARAVSDEHGVRAVPVAADLSTEAGARTLLDGALEAFGRVDVLVTNNGGPPPGAFEEHDLDAWRRAYHLTLESALILVKGVLPGMKERRWGRILNITSIAVKQPVDGLMLSNSIRAAVTGFARTLANEVAGYGVTVNNLMPGYTRTARLDELADRIADDEGIEPAEAFERWARDVPAGRVAEPREFAALAAFLASERASYVTAQSIAVDGGWIRSLL